MNDSPKKIVPSETAKKEWNKRLLKALAAAERSGFVGLTRDEWYERARRPPVEVFNQTIRELRDAGLVISRQVPKGMIFILTDLADRMLRPIKSP